MSERSLFLAALEIDSPAERSAYLERVCAGDGALRSKVEALLESHRAAGDFMDEPAFNRLEGARPAEVVNGISGDPRDAGLRTSVECPGSVIANYKLLEQIGEGGFGIVYMADQLRPIHRRVALKVLKPGMDSRQIIARFEAERQALALMDHPNIARVLDGGETEAGRPYFVMELVRGIPFTDFCDQNQLPVRRRLELFVSVCQAVQHAHQKGIIHRDLKPTNILITLHDGVPLPKVIDFGIAKALGQQLTDKTLFTGFAQMIGTPTYMSPEQAGMNLVDMDTRSDIYSLGVILYELLTGTTPCDKERIRTCAYDEIRRIICEEEPPRPSVRLTSLGKAAVIVSAQRSGEPRGLGQLFRRELDWIVLKALEKDRNRRYETASALADDVQRFLRDESVQACPPSALYRFRRAIRRNKGLFVAATLLFLALSFGMLGTTWGLLRANRSKLDVLTEAEAKEKALAAARESEREVKDKLFLALLNQGRAGRLSHQMGQRFESLDALTKAAALRSDGRLRDEVTAALALPDLRRIRSWPAFTRGFTSWTFDADYKLYARGDAEGVIRIHRAEDGREVGTVIDAPRKVANLALSPDGRFVCGFGNDADLLVWRVADGAAVLRESCTRYACCFSPDCRHVALARGREIICFDLATGRETNRWQIDAGTKVYQLVFHPDSRRIAVACNDAERVTVYDAGTGEVTSELTIGKVMHPCLAWHPNGKLLAVSGSDPRIQIWDVATQRKLESFDGTVQQVTSLSFHPDGEVLASYSWEGVLRLWDVPTGRQLMQLPLSIVGAQFSRDGHRLGVVHEGEDAQLLEVQSSKEYHTIASQPGVPGSTYYDAILSPDGRLLALDLLDGGLHLWDLESRQELAALPEGRPIFQPDGRELLICSSKAVQRWPIRQAGSGEALRLGPPHSFALPVPFERAAMTADGRTLAVASETHDCALIVDLLRETVSEPLPHPSGGFVAISHDGHYLATAGWNSDQVRLWDARSHKMIREWFMPRSMVFFTPDNSSLVISEADAVTIWDLQRLEQIRRFSRDEVLFPSCVAFTATGDLMACEVAPGVIHLLEVKTGRKIARLEDPHSDRTGWLAFTPDDTRLVTMARYAKCVHIWNLRAIREHLKHMDLDWDWPEFAPLQQLGRGTPLRLEVQTGPDNGEAGKR